MAGHDGCGRRSIAIFVADAHELIDHAGVALEIASQLLVLTALL
jgi:hypothetical protein